MWLCIRGAVGFGPLLGHPECWAWARFLLFGPDITRLRSACLLMFRGLAYFHVHEQSWLFVSSDLNRSMGNLDTCPHLRLLGICGLGLPGHDIVIKDSRLGRLLSVIGAAKVSHFEIMCHVLSRPPTLDTIRRFYVNSISNGWLSFSQRSVCPLSIMWFNGSSIFKDPLPVDGVEDLICMELLNDNRTVIRKYPKAFLCVVGLSRTFTETNIRPTFLYSNDEEIGLLDFVKSANPFKVKVGERTLAENERKEGMAFVSRSPPVKKARAKGVAISEPRPATVGKSPTALRRLVKQSGQADIGFGSIVVAMEDFVSSSVTLTPLQVYEYDFGYDGNVRTCHPSGHFTILSSSSADTDIVASPQVVPLAPSVLATANFSAVEPLAETRGSSVPDTEVGMPSVSENEAGNLSATPSQSSPRDAEITDLKTKLEKSKREASEVVELRGRVSELEAGLAAKSGEVVSLNGRNSELLGKVSSLKSTREELNSQVSKLIVDCEVLRNEEAGEAKLREEFNDEVCSIRRVSVRARQGYIFGDQQGVQEGLEAGIEHEYVAAVTDFENVSFALLDELESLKDSPLTYMMYALVLKDDQANVNSNPELHKFQPSFDHVIIYIYSESGSVIREIPLSEVIPTVRVAVERRGLCPPSSSVSGEDAIPAPLQESSLGVADYQVSTLTFITDEVPVTPSAVTQPYDDLFATVLDKPADA
ncbi:hypothetical protein Tco_0331838 [Tanacetum coccineum]